MRAVVAHMTALAEGTQIRGAVVGGVVVEMSCGQRHVCVTRDVVWACGRFAAAVAPCPGFWIMPASVGDALDGLAVRPATVLAMAAGADEPDPMA